MEIAMIGRLIFIIVEKPYHVKELLAANIALF